MTSELENLLEPAGITVVVEANISPFSTGPLANIIDPHGRCEKSRQLVEGTFNYDLIDTMDIDHKEELKMIL